MIIIKDSPTKIRPFRRCCRNGKRKKSYYDYFCRRMRLDCGNLWDFYANQPITEEEQKFVDDIVNLTTSVALLKVIM